jgi:hypothetical protein
LLRISPTGQVLAEVPIPALCLTMQKMTIERTALNPPVARLQEPRRFSGRGKPTHLPEQREDQTRQMFDVIASNI